MGLAAAPPIALAAQPAKPAPAKKPAKPAAKPDDDPKRAEARTHYADAEARFQNGDFEGAYTGYKAANDLMMAPQTLYKMAVCLDRLDKTNEAITAYQTFLSSSPPASMDAKVSESQGRITDLKKKLPAVVKVRSDPPAAAVMLDGAPQTGATPLDVKATAGRHKIRVTSPGYDPYEKDIELEGGSEITVEATLPKSSGEAPAAAAVVAETQPGEKPAVEPEQHSNVAAYVVLGLAGAGAVVGTIFGVKALNGKSDYNNTPPENRTSEMADDVERDALIADMALGAAITLGVTGIVLLVSNSGPSTPASKSALRADRTALKVTPVIGPGRGGVAAAFRF